MIPRNIIQRLTYPVVVHAYNQSKIQRLMTQGQVLFVQREDDGRKTDHRMRSVNHIALMEITVDMRRDCLLRRGNKYRLDSPLEQLPKQLPDDILLPVQPSGLPIPLCFGDRLIIHGEGKAHIVDPMQHISWPILRIGDTVLVVPQEGDWILVNRQPTLVQSWFCCEQNQEQKRVCWGCGSASVLIFPSRPLVRPLKPFEETTFYRLTS